MTPRISAIPWGKHVTKACTRAADRACAKFKVTWRRPGDACRYCAREFTDGSSSILGMADRGLHAGLRRGSRRQCRFDGTICYRNCGFWRTQSRDAQVRITDPDEIQQILTLVRKVRRGFTYARVNLDMQRAKIVRIQISPEDGASDITMVSGMMTVPGSEDGLVYVPASKAQSELWALLLARLESANAK